MRVLVSDLGTGQYSIDLEAKNTIAVLKYAIAQENGIPPDQQRLIYGGKELQDYQELKYYNISEGSTVHLLSRSLLRSRDTESQQASSTVSTNFPKPTSTIIDDSFDEDEYYLNPRAYSSNFEAFEKKTVEDSALSRSRDNPESQQASTTVSTHFPTPTSTIIDDSFDDDEHILNPRAYFSKLEALEKETVQGSALSRFHGEPDVLRMRVFPAAEARDITNIPDHLRVRFEKTSFIQGPPGLANTVGGPEPDELWQQKRNILVYLCQSYFIICRVLQRFSSLQQSKFCTSFFSLLRWHKENDVAEIVRLRASQIEDIKFGMEAAIKHVSDTIGDGSFEAILRQNVEIPCTVLLEDAGIMPAGSRPRITQCILTLCHMTAVLLDLALVSYVGSHGLPFCANYLRQESQVIEMQGKSEDDFSFRCSMQPFSCLHGFLDQGTAWVFHFSPGRKLPSRTDPPAKVKLSILARMEDFADIWGPVWTIPAESGLIKRYNVSKGVICRVGHRQNVFNAVQCHWYSRASFHRRCTSKLLTRSEDLLLANDDLLLIGGVFRQNHHCHYTLGDYEAEYGNGMGTLGTTPSYWKADTRGLSLGLSKVFGVTVSGSQKLIPQTTLKQHILDKWTNNATRANPGLLNQYLGVEISNCTGNARRISLKHMLLLQAVSPLLERQIPRWTESLWGSSFLAALRNTRDPEAIYNVWRDFPDSRTQMAELVCCVLDVLDTTGRRESEFLAGFLYEGQESSVLLDYKRNYWARLLEDSHLSGVYAVINEVCLECQLPNHSAMTCTCSDVYTVLQTKVRSDSYPGYNCKKMSLHGKIYGRADAGSDQIFLFEPTSRSFLTRPKVSAWEVLNPSESHHCLDIYIRASSRSFHGREVPRRGGIASAKRLIAGRETENESQPDLQPGHTPPLSLEEHSHSYRNSRRRISPHAHSPTRYQVEATEDRDPEDGAHGLIHNLRDYAIEDNINDTATRYAMLRNRDPTRQVR